MSATSSVYTEEHKLFRESFRKFLEKEMVPYFPQWEEERKVPREAWKKFGQQGFLCPWVEEEYGGAGVGFEYSVIMIEEMVKAGVDIPVSLHADVVAPYIARFGNEEQKRKWLPGVTSGDILLAVGMTEPSTGSDLAAIRTTARREGDEYVINGQKVFITNGRDADLVILACKTNPSANPPHAGISLIAVEADRPGFRKGPDMKKIGHHAHGTCELFFDDCRVPASNLIGQEGAGFIYLMQTLQQERLVSAAACIAQAEAMLQETIRYTKERTAFGKPISKFQHNTFKIVEMATEIEIGRTFFDQLLARHLRGERIVKEVSMAKWWLSEMANRVAQQCLQLHGGYGYMLEYPIARRFLGVRIETIWAGTTEIMKLIIAKEMGL
jgi:acyl-CoA dehydrogenase